MSFLQILQIMFPILFISTLGYLYARLNRTEPQVLSNIIIYLTIPALFFNSFYKHRLILIELPIIFLTLILVMLGTFILVYILRKVLKLPLMLYPTSLFMNSSFVGFPVMLLAYGEAGLMRAISYDFFNGILIFTLGIYLASQRKDLLEIFKFPFIYAALLGLTFNLTGLRLPATLIKSIEMLGGITIPLALLMLGFRLSTTRIKSLALPLLSSVLRMGLGALIAYLAVLLFKIDGLLAKSLIVMSTLPSAFMGLVLAERYKKDEDFTASAIALCTLLSIFTIPLLLWILK